MASVSLGAAAFGAAWSWPWGAPSGPWLVRARGVLVLSRTFHYSGVKKSFCVIEGSARFSSDVLFLAFANFGLKNWFGMESSALTQRAEQDFSAFVWSKLLKFLLSCESIKYYPELRLALSAGKTCSLFQIFFAGSNFKDSHAGRIWGKLIPPAQPGMWKFSPACLWLLYEWCETHPALRSALGFVFGLCQLHSKLSLPHSFSKVPAGKGQVSPSLGWISGEHTSDGTSAFSTTCA